MTKKGSKKTTFPVNFEKLRKLGEGSDSVVWAVKHEETGKELALKISTEPDPAHRLQREFAILERLDYPGVIKVSEFGEHEGLEYFTMEIIPGKPITTFMNKRRTRKDFLEVFITTFRKTATILGRLHKEGIIHIDLKPANLLVKEKGEEEGDSVLLDFGFSEDYVLSPTAEARGTTLAYAAPELFSGGEITPAADIYSLGVIAYEILSGAMLGIEKSSQELLSYKLKTPPRFGKLDVQLPPGLEALVFRMLNPEPGLRPSADEVVAEIEWITKGEKVEVKTAPMIPRLCFGGRDAETAKLEKLVFDQKKIVLLSGKQSIGKTRLLRELRFRAILDGRNVLFIEGRGAHLSIVEYLASTLGILHPKIESEKEQRPDKWSRYERIFQAIDKAGFDGVMLDAPADINDDEAGLLGYMARGFEGKVGFVLSSVPDQVHPEGAKVELAPLGEVEVQSIVSKTFEGLKEMEKLASTLVLIAQGNPRRMNELLSVLHSEGWLTWKRGWVYEPGKDEKGLAARLEGWLGARIEGLDDDAREILSLFSVAESSLPLEVITRVQGESASLILTGLTNEGFIKTFIHTDKPHFEIQNELVRAYVQSKLSAKKKKALAKQLAEALEEYCFKIWGKDKDKWDTNYLTGIAASYREDSEEKQGSSILISAGKRLRELYNYPKAKELLSKGLDFELSREEKKEILHELGVIANEEHNPKKAEKYYSKILPLTDSLEEKASILMLICNAYQQAKDTKQAEAYLRKSEECLAEPPKTLKYKLFFARGWNAFMRREMDDAIIHFKSSLEFAESNKERGRSLYSLTLSFLCNGNLEDALLFSASAIEALEKASDKVFLCKALLLVPQIHIDLGKNTHDDVYFEKAKSIIEKMSHPVLTAHFLRNKAWSLYESGLSRQARAVSRQAVEVLTKINDRYGVAIHKQEEANASRELGDYGSAENIYRGLWKEHYSSSSTSRIPAGILQGWALIYRLRGDFSNARRILQKAKSIAEKQNDQYRILWLESVRCHVGIESGNLPEAKTALKKSKKLAEELQDIIAIDWLNILQAEVYLMEGNYEAALITISKLTEEIDASRIKQIKGEIRNIQGKAQIGLGKINEGLVNLKESLNVFKTSEQLYWQGITLYAIAEAMFEHQGYSEEAVSPLEEAETIFERLGAKHLLEKIEKLRTKYIDGREKIVEGSNQYLESLREVSEVIKNKLGDEDFLSELLSITLNLTGAERGMVFVVEGDDLHPVASQRIDSATAEDAQRISSTIVLQMRYEQQPIYTMDAMKDRRFNRSQSILINKIRSFICVPLMVADKILGTIYLDSTRAGIFKPDNLLYFETLGNLLATSIDKSAEFKRMQERLALVRQRKYLGKIGIVVGSSPAMKKLCKQLDQIAKSDANVLLEGETGTGKGVFARMIHDQSPRENKDFCSINCGILPENIFVSELFGAKKGAYTGAVVDRIGLLEAADCSTVFFDEITNTSPAMQAKLLEVIEEKIIRRMGDTKTRKVNLRFIFATNRDLREEVREGRFRKDLYFRINTVTLKLPPLRKRKEDIPEFVYFFLKRFSAEFNKDVTCVAEDALEVIYKYSWPGNIRELRSTIERAVLLASGTNITRDILEPHLFASSTPAVSNLKEMTDNEKKKAIEQTLRDTNGKIGQAAERLGISRRHLSRLLKRYGISPQSD